MTNAQFLYHFSNSHEKGQTRVREKNVFPTVVPLITEYIPRKRVTKFVSRQILLAICLVMTMKFILRENFVHKNMSLPPSYPVDILIL